MAKHQNNLSGIFIWNFRQQIYHRQSVWRFPYPNKNDAKKVETRNPSFLSIDRYLVHVHPILVIRGEDMIQIYQQFSTLVRLKMWQTDDVITNQPTNQRLPRLSLRSFLRTEVPVSRVISDQSFTLAVCKAPSVCWQHLGA